MRNKNKSFPMRVVRPWPRLPREAVAAPSLAVLKARLDGALSTLGCGKGSLLAAGGWAGWPPKFPSPPKPFHDSMNSRATGAPARRDHRQGALLGLWLCSSAAGSNPGRFSLRRTGTNRPGAGGGGRQGRGSG